MDFFGTLFNMSIWIPSKVNFYLFIFLFFIIDNQIIQILPSNELFLFFYFFSYFFFFCAKLLFLYFCFVFRSVVVGSKCPPCCYKTQTLILKFSIELISSLKILIGQKSIEERLRLILRNIWLREGSYLATEIWIKFTLIGECEAAKLVDQAFIFCWHVFVPAFLKANTSDTCVKLGT